MERCRLCGKIWVCICVATVFQTLRHSSPKSDIPGTMPSRKERFIDEDSRGILIDDAVKIFKTKGLHTFGFRYVLGQPQEDCLKLLKEDIKKNSLLSSAWGKAEHHLDLIPGEKGMLDSLPRECQVAIVAYSLETPNLYSDFNRKSLDLLSFFDWADFPYQGMWLLMHKAISSPAGDLKSKVTVYRGCKVLISANISSLIKFQQITSTSTNRQVAEDFAKGGTLFIIQVSQALGIKSLSAYPEEEEYLISPNDAFKVINVKQVGGLREIHLESKEQSLLF